MSVYGVVCGAFVSLLGLFIIVRQVNRNRMPTAHYGARSQPRAETTRSETKLCEMCGFPQKNNSAKWMAFTCGHCYHANCHEQLGVQSCFTCYVTSKKEA